jgi:tetratricopeptide (TPR) repeat protein
MSTPSLGSSHDLNVGKFQVNVGKSDAEAETQKLSGIEQGDMSKENNSSGSIERQIPLANHDLLERFVIMRNAEEDVPFDPVQATWKDVCHQITNLRKKSIESKQRGNRNKARELLRQAAAALNPEGQDALKGSVHDRLRQYRELAVDMRLCLQGGKEDALELLRQAKKELNSDVSQVAMGKMSPGNRVAECCGLTDAFIKAGGKEEAQEFLDKAKAELPGLEKYPREIGSRRRMIAQLEEEINKMK